MNDFTSVKGKVAVVTGATAGIGKATAKIFAANGMKVVLSGRRKELGDSIVEEIKEAGGEATFVQGDMAVAEEVKNLMQTTIETYGGLHVLVNNAGASTNLQPLHEYEVDEFRRITEIDYIGVYMGMKYAVEAMLESKSEECAIINISSTEGIFPSANFSTYSGAKAGVVSLTKTAGLDYARHDITVNAICPGAIDTDIYSTISPEQRELTQSMIPAGVFGQPEDIAHMALFLATDMARYITSAIIPVDAGLRAGTYTEVEWNKPDTRN